MTAALVLAVALTAMPGRVKVELASPTEQIDLTESVFLTVTVTAPPGVRAEVADLRDRFEGFSLVEDFEAEPKTRSDGTVVRCTEWRLVPEPCAPVYRVRPFVVTVSPAAESFVAGPLYFKLPAAPQAVGGEMEVVLKKDFPRITWRFAGLVLAGLLALAALTFALILGLRYFARRVREHRMSPIERAWAELDRLLGRNLLGRGRYKDFYVELTMVVRRYVQRRHGVVAPHLTTEEFFVIARNSASFPQDTVDELVAFLQQADMVKFAGVEATPEAAERATAGARQYIVKDDELSRLRGRRREEAGQ